MRKVDTETREPNSEQVVVNQEAVVESTTGDALCDVIRPVYTSPIYWEK